MTKPLPRVGILIDSPRLPRWAYEVILKLAASNCADFVVTLLDAAPRLRTGSTSFFAAFEALDRLQRGEDAEFEVIPL